MGRVCGSRVSDSEMEARGVGEADEAPGFGVDHGSTLQSRSVRSPFRTQLDPAVKMLVDLRGSGPIHDRGIAIQ